MKESINNAGQGNMVDKLSEILWVIGDSRILD